MPEGSQRFPQLGRGIPAGERIPGVPVLWSLGLWWVPHVAVLMWWSCLTRGVLALPQKGQGPGAGTAGVSSCRGAGAYTGNQELTGGA